MNRFELIKDDEKYIINVSAAEDARIKREIRAAYRIINNTAAKLIEHGVFEGFGFDREIIDAIIKSKNASEPYIVGRFDTRYAPGQPVKFYELNTLYAGEFSDKYVEEIKMRFASLGCAENVFENGLKSAWKTVARYVKERAIPEVGYLSVAPDVEDAEFLNAEAACITAFANPKLKTSIVPANCPPDDYFGIRAYLNNSSDNRLLLPAAWSMLLDNKAIWAYAHMLSLGRQPNLIPTSFDPMDFIDPEGYLHTYWQKNRHILARPVYDCQGQGQIHIKSLEQAHASKGDGVPRVYSAWTPEWGQEDGAQIQMQGYILNGGRSAAYKFGWVFRSVDAIDFEPIPHSIEASSSQYNRSAVRVLAIP